MQLSVIAYVSNMDRALTFYDSLGFARRGKKNSMWNEFVFGDAVFALHGAMSEELPPPSNRLTLNVGVSGSELERLYTVCEERGYPTGGPIEDIGFGRYFWTTDPDGLPVQFNETQG